MTERAVRHFSVSSDMKNVQQAPNQHDVRTIKANNKQTRETN